MDLSMDGVLPGTQDLKRTGPTSAQPASALTHDDLKYSSPGPRQRTEQVQNEVDSLKRSAALSYANLKESDIKIGKNVIIVDDRFQRR